MIAKRQTTKQRVSCWDCKYMDTSGICFPGRCSWFKEVKNEKPREIPGSRVGIGCNFFQMKTY